MKALNILGKLSVCLVLVVVALDVLKSLLSYVTEDFNWGVNNGTLGFLLRVLLLVGLVFAILKVIKAKNPFADL